MRFAQPGETVGEREAQGGGEGPFSASSFPTRLLSLSLSLSLSIPSTLSALRAAAPAAAPVRVDASILANGGTGVDALAMPEVDALARKLRSLAASQYAARVALFVEDHF